MRSPVCAVEGRDGVSDMTVGVMDADGKGASKSCVVIMASKGSPVLWPPEVAAAAAVSSRNMLRH